MTDAAEEAAVDGQPTADQAALAAEAAVRGGTAPSPAAYPTAATADERPELAVGAAFAGGLVLALFLKRLAR
jgi:hypothetical protein